MPPIPVHIDDPITPQKPQGVTSQTSAEAPLAPTPASNVATTTTAVGNSTSPYPAARPGAAAAPAPTGYVPRPQPEATRTVQGGQENGPPPPQPGAVPIPPSQQTAGSGIPPPPRAGESVQQGTSFTGALNQMHIPPPQQNYAPTHSTSTTTTPQRGPTTLNLGNIPTGSPATYDNRRVSSERPQGYVQNVYAQEMNAAQRASLEAQEGEGKRESFIESLGLGGAMGSLSGGGSGNGDRRVSGEGGVWDAAKGWLGKAGEALKEGEEEVWRRINGR